MNDLKAACTLVALLIASCVPCSALAEELNLQAYTRDQRRSLADELSRFLERLNTVLPPWDEVTWDSFGLFTVGGWRVKDQAGLEDLIAQLKSEQALPMMYAIGLSSDIRIRLESIRGRLVTDPFRPTGEGPRHVRTVLTDKRHERIQMVRSVRHHINVDLSRLEKTLRRELAKSDRSTSGTSGTDHDIPLRDTATLRSPSISTTTTSEDRLADPYSDLRVNSEEPPTSRP